MRVFTLFDPEKCSELDHGKAVELRIGAIGVGNDGERCLRYYLLLMRDANNNEKSRYYWSGHDQFWKAY